MINGGLHIPLYRDTSDNPYSGATICFTDPAKGPLQVVKIVDGRETETFQLDAQQTEDLGEFLAIGTGDHIAWAIWRLKDIAEHAVDISIQITACDAIVRCVTRMAGIS